MMLDGVISAEVGHGWGHTRFASSQEDLKPELASRGSKLELPGGYARFWLKLVVSPVTTDDCHCQSARPGRWGRSL
jgi:hypothetical protein